MLEREKKQKTRMRRLARPTRRRCVKKKKQNKKNAGRNNVKFNMIILWSTTNAAPLLLRAHEAPQARKKNK